MEMDLEELSERAGVLPRTVRYYVSEGLLPPPLYGKPAKYTEEHLERLLLIKRLQKELYMPLEKIRERFAKQTTDQLREYLEQALAREAGLQEQVAPAAPSVAAFGIAEQSTPGSALDYIQGILGRRLKYAPAAAPTPNVAPAAPGQDAEGGAQSPQKAQRAFTMSAAPVSLAASPPVSLAEKWTRLTLAPGIELNFLVSDDLEFKAIVARLLQAVAEAGLLQGPEKERT